MAIVYKYNGLVPIKIMIPFFGNNEK